MDAKQFDKLASQVGRRRVLSAFGAAILASLPWVGDTEASKRRRRRRCVNKCWNTCIIQGGVIAAQSDGSGSKGTCSGPGGRCGNGQDNCCPNLDCPAGTYTCCVYETQPQNCSQEGDLCCDGTHCHRDGGKWACRADKKEPPPPKDGGHEPPGGGDLVAVCDQECNQRCGAGRRRRRRR